MAEMIVNKNNFEKEVLEADSAVLVDFYASWCNPCRMLAPVLEEFANAHSDIKVCKVDIDDEEELAQEYDITSVPALILFKDGKLLKTLIGYIDIEGLEQFIL